MGVAAPRPSFVVILADDVVTIAEGELAALYESWAESAGVGLWPWVIRPLRWAVAALGLAELGAAALVFARLRRKRLVR